MNIAKRLLLYGGGSSLPPFTAGDWSVEPAFDPASLFASGEQGGWFDPMPEYLFQDAAGTIPVTGDGQPVGLMLDRSGNGNHATQNTAAKRPLYRTDGVLHWLDFDGVDDRFHTNIPLAFDKASVIANLFWKTTETATNTKAGPALFGERPGGGDNRFYAFNTAIGKGSSFPLFPAVAFEKNIYRYTWFPEGCAAYRNGVYLNGNNDTLTGPVNVSFLGHGNTGDYATFNIYSLIIVNEVLSQEEIDNSEEYVTKP